MKNCSKIYFVVFFCSFSSLAYEIVLTRIFSISLWYHFAFMIISIAMLGIGASGTVLSLYPGLKKISYISTYSLLLGIGIGLSYIVANHIPFDPVQLSWSRVQILYIGIYYITLSIPFFFSGLVIATALSSLSDRPGLLYGADLLGAGMGSLGMLYLMTLASPDRVVFLMSSTALSAAFLSGNKILKVVSSVLISSCITIVLINPSFVNLRMSPYKGLQQALRYPGAEHLSTYFSPYSQVDTFKSPSVRFAPGLSLRYLDKLPEQIGFSIDGGEINAITKYNDKSLLEFIQYLPSSLPYEILSNLPLPSLDKDESVSFIDKKHGNVLILDPRGGLQSLVAEYYGYLDVYKTESNPLLIKVIRKDFNEFSGGIFSQNSWPGLGRSWLKQTEKLFDIIDIPMTGAAPSGSFGISEDYRFTVEAFKEYLSHLTPQGFLSINLFILPPPRIELRLLNTVVRAMEELGEKDIEKHIAAIRSWGSICILVKKSPFSFKEIQALKKFTKTRRFDLIHYPGILESETNIYVRMPQNEYFTAFRNLLNPETRRQFVNSYIFDINPVYDERPFFHYYLKLKNISEIYRIMGQKWQYFIEEGYILPAVFIQVLLLSLILIILPVFSKKYKNNPSLPTFYRGRLDGFENGLLLLPYFALLGIGFMFIEVSLIQKMILPLENPPYAAATVLTSMLISSGIGSLLSHKFHALRSPSSIIAISLLVIIYSIFLSAVSDSISPYPITIKIVLVFLLLMPPGFFMGIPFPAGLKLLGEKNESLIPWAWAINGCLSVLAPLLTIMLAMVIGFKTVLWIGALAYMMAFLILKSFIRKSF